MHSDLLNKYGLFGREQ